MTLLLTLEHGPRAQTVRQARLDEGELLIGRGAEAGWQISDPDMFISRTHCKIAADGDGYVITDTSSSGLYIDDAASPLGAGNRARLKNGMRLRLGDYIVGVEVQATTRPTQTTATLPPPPPNRPANMGSDDFFSLSVPEEPKRPRPADLPNPFEQPTPGAFARAASSERNSAAFDDPFSLDPVATPSANGSVIFNKGGGPAFDDPFGLDAIPAPSQPITPKPFMSSDFGDSPKVEPARVPERPVDLKSASRDEPIVQKLPRVAPWEMPGTGQQPLEPAPPPSRPVERPGAGAKPVRMQEPPAASPDSDLRAAFLRGMGIDDIDTSRDPIAEMEKFGREYRLMMEGLMQLLRKRAEEKGNARVAQTVVGSSAVNPLKFLPTADDVLSIIIAGRSPGFLDGEAAVKDAIRDLAEHHVRAWRGIQGALRSMIDCFDPATIEEELKSSSAIGTLLSGGRGAKLWELYQKRHREIAQQAESRFLGEVGADFRNAYEEE